MRVMNVQIDIRKVMERPGDAMNGIMKQTYVFARGITLLHAELNLCDGLRRTAEKENG